MDIDGVTAAGVPITLAPVGAEVIIDPAFTSVPDWQQELGCVVAPVPASEFVNVSFAKDINKMPYQLFGARGEMVFEGEFTQSNSRVDLSRLSKGVYQLRIQSDNGIMIRKIIKI
jgi:hypothetical protein